MSLFNEECIYNYWIHSYEEDSEKEKVYRLSTFEFPPSRGRDGFEIKENGEFILYTMDPADRHGKVFGNFTIDSNKIHVELTSNIQRSFIMTILSCDENRLTIQKN